MTVMLREALTNTPPVVIPAPALIFTVTSPLKLVLSPPSDGWSASQSTLAVPTPEQ
ncbi:hypothetical protein ACVIGB_001424 [Bradyrhizobium sp. USDA 4341]